MEPLRIETALAAVTGEKTDVDRAVADLEKARKTDPILTWPTLQAEFVLFSELGDVKRLEQTVESIYDFYVEHPDSKPAADLLRQTLVFGLRPPGEANEQAKKAFKTARDKMLITVIEKHPPAWTPFYFYLLEHYLGARKDAVTKQILLKRLRAEAGKLRGKNGIEKAALTRELDYLEALATFSKSFRTFCGLTEQYFDRYGKDEHAGRLMAMVLSGLIWRMRDHAELDELPDNRDGSAWMRGWQKLVVKDGKGCSKAREQSLELAYHRWLAVAESARQKAGK